MPAVLRLQSPRFFGDHDVSVARYTTKFYKLAQCASGPGSSAGRADRMAGVRAGRGQVAGAAPADWFVLPSASENFGIAAAEALAAGTPVILSPGVANAEAVAAAGVGRLTDPNPEALARTLSECLQPASERLHQEARDFAASTYGWEPIAQQLRGRYGRLLDG